MSNAKDVIEFYKARRDKHAAPYLDWEEFDALAKSHAELVAALEIARDELQLWLDSEGVGYNCREKVEAALAKARGEGK